MQSANAEFQLTDIEKAFLEEHPVIKVHNEIDWPPFNYAENGVPRGFSIDYMELVADKIGVNIEFITGPSWNDFLGMMKDGTLDVMLNIVKTPERQEYLLYTPPYADNPNAILSKRDTLYDSIESLFGKTVALPKGFFTEEILRTNYPQINLHPVTDMLSAMKAVSFGKADAALGELAVFNHLLASHMMSDLAVSGEALLGDPEYSLLNIATRKDLPVLASILTKGVQAVTRDEISSLQKKWLFTSPNTIKVQLTAQEEAFVKQHRVIKVHNEVDWPPYNYAEDGKPMGFSIDYMNLLAKHVGLKVEYVTGPSWNEFLKMMKDGTLDVMLNIVKTPEREKYLLYTPSYADNPNVIVSKKGHEYESIEALFGKTVSLPKGFFTEEVLKAEYPQIKLYPVTDMLEAMKAVSFGNADAALGELAVANHLITENLLTDLVISGEAVMGNPEFSLLNIATRKDLPVLASILSKGVKSITREEQKELQNKWLLKSAEAEKISLTDTEAQYLNNKKELKACVSANWMPFGDFNKDGKYTGIGADIIGLFQEYLKKNITLIKNDTWLQHEHYIKSGKCDFSVLDLTTRPTESYANYSKPYITESVVVATREDEFFIEDSGDLSGQKVGVVKGFPIGALLRVDDIEIVYVDSPREGLKKVHDGEFFGYVDALPSIAYSIQKTGLVNLKIAGRLEFDVSVSIATSTEQPQLASIAEKVLDRIGEAEMRKIVGKWVTVKVEQSLDYKKLGYVTGVFVLIVLVVAYKNRSIRKINKLLQHSHMEIEQKNRMLEALAVTDNLTQLYNRRKLDETLEYEYNRVNRSDSTFGVIIIDIDHFKSINDVHGHQVGDQVLREFAEILKVNSRKTDTVGRWGGEEFLVVCGGSRLNGLEKHAQSICEEVASYPFSFGEQTTASFGVAIYQDGEDIKDLVARADEALYKAKKNGRNQVVSL